MNETDAADGPQVKTQPPSVNSWAFWKKRLGRALIVGALALTATQILPALPEDQRVEIVAPPGIRLSKVRLTYFAAGERDALAGTEITPAEPTEKLPHLIRLPHGDYAIEVTAHGTNPGGTGRIWRVSRTVSLDGATATLRLDR